MLEVEGAVCTAEPEASWSLKGALEKAVHKRSRRTRVVETEILAHDEVADEWVSVPWITGVFSYYRTADAYVVDILVVHPDGPVTEVLEEICGHLKGMTTEQEQRKVIKVVLRDRDEAGLRKQLPFWKSRGFECRLIRDYFGGTDGWECTWRNEDD